MRWPHGATLAGVIGFCPASALAQHAPWGADPSATAASTPATPAAPTELPTPRASRWPSFAQRPAPPRAPAAPLRRESPEAAADHNFQLPTARLLRLGDLMGHYVSALGWVGMRYGLTRVVDVGVGVPYYFAGLSVDARVGIVQRQGLAVSWWLYATVPFKPEGERPTSNLGFTWAYAGLGWLTGPLVSFWNSRVGFHVGLHVAQRTGFGGMWFVGHATLDVRVFTGVKLIAQSVLFYELSEEQGERARSLLGNGNPRVLPYALAGVRFHTRRFAADVGALIPLSDEAPLGGESLAALPWMSLSHLF